MNAADGHKLTTEGFFPSAKAISGAASGVKNIGCAFGAFGCSSKGGGSKGSGATATLGGALGASAAAIGGLLVSAVACSLYP